MILRNTGLVLNAKDSRSTFLRETRAATGLFFAVKTRVSWFEISAASKKGSSSFGSFMAFICAIPFQKSKDDYPFLSRWRVCSPTVNRRCQLHRTHVERLYAIPREPADRP